MGVGGYWGGPKGKGEGKGGEENCPVIHPNFPGGCVIREAVCLALVPPDFIM